MSGAARRGRGEAGDTLIEVLIASVLMAVVVFAIVGGFATTMLTSTVHRSQADANAVLVSAMERVKAADVPRVPCYPAGADPAAAYGAEAQTVTLPGPGWSSSDVVIDSVRYESVGAVGGVPTVTFGTTCQETANNTLTLQLVTLTVTAPGGQVSQTLSFIKGDH